MANSFVLDISRFVSKSQAAPEKVVRKVTVDMAARIIDRTPVGNPSLWKGPAPAGYVGGRLRANWNVSFGDADTSTTADTDASGAQSKARAALRISGWKPDTDAWIANSLPYAIPVERGHSAQAPAGMVAITTAEFQSFVNNAVRSLPR